MMKTITILAVTLAAAHAIPSPFPLQPRTDASSTLPHCFYDYGCPLHCTSSPDPTTCQPSIDSVCRKLASVTPNNHAQWIYSATSNGTLLPPSNVWFPNGQSDCMAVVRFSAAVTSFPSVESCQRTFAGIQGCANAANENYDSTCVGGSINLQFCGDKNGLVLDSSLPAYALGNGDNLHILPVLEGVGVLTQPGVDKASQADVEDSLDLGPYTLERWEELQPDAP